MAERKETSKDKVIPEPLTIKVTEKLLSAAEVAARLQAFSELGSKKAEEQFSRATEPFDEQREMLERYRSWHIDLIENLCARLVEEESPPQLTSTIIDEALSQVEQKRLLMQKDREEIERLGNETRAIILRLLAA